MQIWNRFEPRVSSGQFWRIWGALYPKETKKQRWIQKESVEAYWLNRLNASDAKPSRLGDWAARVWKSPLLQAPKMQILQILSMKSSNITANRIVIGLLWSNTGWLVSLSPPEEAGDTAMYLPRASEAAFCIRVASWVESAVFVQSWALAPWGRWHFWRC